jgi:hypothetical protein
MIEVPSLTTIMDPTPNGTINWPRLIGLLAIVVTDLGSAVEWSDLRSTL